MALNGAESSLMLAAVLVWRKESEGVGNPTVVECCVGLLSGGVIGRDW